MTRAPLTVGVALLFGAASACSTSGEATAPTSSLPSNAITFEDGSTQIKGNDLQTLLVAMDQQLAAHAAAAAASELRIAALEEERDALKAANTTLVGRVQALESAPPPEFDVLATAVVSDTLPPTTLLAALESLHTAVGAIPPLQGDVTALKLTAEEFDDLSQALTECPDGTAPAGDFCMELAAHGEDVWVNANYFCAAAGGHVCSTGEFATACNSIGPLQPGIFAPELTTNVVVDPVTNISGAIQLFDGELCSFSGDKISAGNVAPYRCCYDRLVLGAGPKPAAPTLP